MRFTWRRRRLIYWLKKEAKNIVEAFEEIKACSDQQLADLEKQSAEKRERKLLRHKKRKPLLLRKWLLLLRKRRKKAAAAKKTAAAAEKKRKNWMRGSGKKQRFIFVSFGISGTLRCLLEFIGVFSNTTSCIFE